MSGIRFITNTAWRDCADVYTSSPNLIEGDFNNLVGGPLHVGAKWNYKPSGLYHFGYLDNENYSLAADTFLWVGGADLLTSSNDYSIKKSTAAGVAALTPAECGSTWNSADNILIGANSDDIVLTFTEVTDADGYFFGPASTPTTTTGEWASLIYFSKSCTWDYPAACSIDSIDQAVMIKGEIYEVDRVITLVFEGVTRADLTAFEAQHKIYEQPVGIYDSEGQRLGEKLVIGLVNQISITPQFDDLYLVTVPIQGLRRYEGIFR